MSRRAKSLRRKRRHHRVIFREKPETKLVQKRLNVLEFVLGGFCIIAMILIVFEIQNLENTIGGFALALWSVAVGIIVGVLSAFLLAIWKHFPALDEGECYPRLIIFCILISSPLGSILNRQFPDADTHKQQFLVTEKAETRGGRSGAHHFYLYVTAKNNQTLGRVKRLSVSEKLWQTIDDETLDLSLRTGFFGFPIIEKVEKQYVSPTGFGDHNAESGIIFSPVTLRPLP